MVWGFGDSFTQGCFEGNYLEENYLSIIGAYLNEEVSNKARYGMAFEDINATITKHLQYIKKGDTVIVGGTIIDRIMFPVPYNQIAEYHGTEPEEGFSLTGVNYTTLSYFFESYDIGVDKMKSMGFHFSQAEYSRLIYDYQHMLKNPHYSAYIRFYDDMFRHWEAYFKTISVPFYWWKYNWWKAAPEENIGSCGHWDESYHKTFADILFTFMQNNNSGCLENSTYI